MIDRSFIKTYKTNLRKEVFQKRGEKIFFTSLNVIYQDVKFTEGQKQFSTNINTNR